MIDKDSHVGIAGPGLVDIFPGNSIGGILSSKI